MKTNSGCLFKKKKVMSVGKKLEEMEPLYIDGRNLKWTATVKNYAMICSKNQA